MTENIAIRLMTASDVEQVHEIELATFAVPWSYTSLMREATENLCARYLVITEGDAVLGYAGMWLVLNEAHITNVAIRRQNRGSGLGERLMRALLQLAADSGMTWMTLECRRSNLPAQGLYHKLGFKDLGYRKKYYEDNGEDALIMALEQLPEGHPENDPFIVFED